MAKEVIFQILRDFRASATDGGSPIFKERTDYYGNN